MYFTQLCLKMNVAVVGSVSDLETFTNSAGIVWVVSWQPSQASADWDLTALSAWSNMAWNLGKREKHQNPQTTETEAKEGREESRGVTYAHGAGDI